MAIIRQETEEGETQEIEVPANQIEFQEDDELDGYVSQDELDGIIQKRLSRKERNLRSELKEDEEFFREAANERGIEIREDGRPKGSLKDKELQELKKKASKAETLSEKVQKYESQIQEVRKTKLENQILEQAGDVKDDLKPAFKQMIASHLKWDEDEGEWIATDEDGGIRYHNGEPFGVDRVAEQVKENHPSFLQNTNMNNGPSDSPGETQPEGETMTRSEFEQQRKKAVSSGNREALRELQQKAAQGLIE